MNKEQLKTKTYRKREWGNNTPLHKNLQNLENQLQDLSEVIIEDLIKVDEESEKRLVFFKENDFEQFKGEISIDSEGVKTEISKIKDGVLANTSLIEQTATDINLKITDGDYLVSQINIGVGGVSISGNKIKLNENFIVDELGNLCIKEISASLLTAGTIDADKITVKNLKADSITTGSIITEKIEDGAITTDKIAVDGLDAKVISAGTIDATKVRIINLSAENITVGKVNGDQITPGTITGVQIADGVITTEKLHVNGISADKITSGTISTNRIAVGSLNGDKLVPGTIGTTQIADGVITTDKIHVDGISANKITTGTLQVGSNLVIQGVINGNLAEFTNIKAQNITVGTINGNQISNNTITDSHVINLSANKLTAGTINAGVITVTNINATNITSGTINAERIRIGSLSGSKITPGTITGTEIGDGSITTGKIHANGISADKITTGTLNANRLSVGTEFLVDSTGKLIVNEISASKIKSGEIDAGLITVKNLNADNITAGKLNGGNIGDGQISNNHMKEISADKITGGTISSSIFISSNGTESTSITAGKIIHSRNGQDVTVFRNIKMGIVHTDHIGTGRIIFSDMNKNMRILTALKSFNMPGNIMNAECFAECINIYTNLWKFTLRGSTQSVSPSIKTTHTTQNFSVNCTELNINQISIENPNRNGVTTNYCKTFDLEESPIINIKVYCNLGDGSEKIIFDEDHFIRFEKRLVQESNGKSCWYLLARPFLNQSTITVSTDTQTIKNIRVVVTVVKSDFSIFYSNYPDSYETWRKTHNLVLTPPYDYNKFSIITNHRNIAPSNFSGNGEVQYIAIEI